MTEEIYEFAWKSINYSADLYVKSSANYATRAVIVLGLILGLLIIHYKSAVQTDINMI